MNKTKNSSLFFKIFLIGICLSFLILFSCRCPYGFKVNSLPGHLETVVIPTFKNETFEYGLENEFTQTLIDEVRNDNSLEVVNNREKADSILEGKILNYRKEKSSYDEHGIVTEYKVSISVQWEYFDKIKKSVYAESNRSVGWETYRIPEGDSEELENEAKEEAMNKLAEDIVAKIVQNW